MAYNKLAIETLTNKLNELLEEKKALNYKINLEIQEIQDGLIAVGGNIDEVSNLPELIYDDENHYYIKGSIEN